MKIRNVFKGVLLCCVTFFLVLFCNAQTANDSIVKIGGLSDDQVVMEKANIGVYFQFVHKVKKNKEDLVLTDTLLLVTGNTQSIFLDPYYRENQQKAIRDRRVRSRKATRVNFEHKNLSEIAGLLNDKSDYQEESNGDPTQIYKNRPDKTVSSVYNTFVENYRSTQIIPEFQNWKMLLGNDTIFGYLCRKAEVTYSGRNYIAWFTLDIPINDGPWKFNGLPGLILKVEDKDKFFLYEAIGLQQYKENVLIVQDIKDYEECDLKRFNTFTDKEKSQFMVNFYSDGVLYMTNNRYSWEPYPMEILK